MAEGKKLQLHLLSNWKAKLTKEKTYDFQHQALWKRSDVYTTVFPYRKTTASKNKSIMKSLEDNYYKTLNLLEFNEHDHYHRRSCFKYGKECRFKIPNQVNEKDYI